MTEKFGGLCRGYRFALGVKQKEVAERAGVDPSYYSRIERGKQEPGRETMRRLLKGRRF